MPSIRIARRAVALVPLVALFAVASSTSCAVADFVIVDDATAPTDALVDSNTADASLDATPDAADSAEAPAVVDALADVPADVPDV